MTSALAGGDTGKINPPLREAADREALWAGIANGKIDTVATDHVHRDLAGKAGGIWSASPGCPGLETLAAVMLSEGHSAVVFRFSALRRCWRTIPRRNMGLGHRKGRIALGYDADVAVVDLKRSRRLDRTDVVSFAGYSIYEGWEFQGQVVHTLVRGRPIYRDGAPVADGAGWGVIKGGEH